MNRQVKSMTAIVNKHSTDLYELYHSEQDIDEGDLVILRLLGVIFQYSSVEFNPSFELVESDVS